MSAKPIGPQVWPGSEATQGRIARAQALVVKISEIAQEAILIGDPESVVGCVGLMRGAGEYLLLVLENAGFDTKPARREMELEINRIFPR